MITPVLKNMLVLKTDDDLEDDFWIVIEADIGTSFESEGADIFHFYVVSPKRLVRILKFKEVEIGRTLLITNKFSEESIKNTINSILEKCKGMTWEEVGYRINRYGDWEYADFKSEDYNPLEV